MRKRVTELRRYLLPARFSATGSYPERVHQRTAAFRLLVHAEFESYLEETVTTHVASCVGDWRKNGRSTITLAGLFAYDDTAGRAPTSVLNPPQKPAGSLDDRLNDVVQRYNRQVRVLNHGVREANILGMLLPIGLDVARLDLAWLAELDSWAQERGEIAHQSSGKIQLKLDPAREYTKVKRLLAGFRDLDEEVMRLG